MNGNRNKRFPLMAAVATLVAMLAGTVLAKEPAQVNGVRVDGAAPGEWTHDWDAAVAGAKASGKPIFVNFTGSDWCGWCKLLKRQVFMQSEWCAWASNHVYLAHVDFPNDQKLVPEKYRGRNRKLASSYKVSGYPTCFLLDPNTLEPVGRFGASRDANAKDFVKKVSAAMPGAKKDAKPEGAAPRRPDGPEPARPSSGEPVFQIENGVLRSMRPNGAEEIIVPAEARIVYVDHIWQVRRIVFSEGVEEIRRGDWGYSPGDPLESVSIPKSVRKIQPGAFYGYYRKLRSLDIAEGAPYSLRGDCLVDTRDATMLYALPGRERIDVPEGVKMIADYAFNGNGDVCEVVLPDGVEKIGKSAFASCHALESVTISATVFEIGDYAFSHCQRLSKIDVALGNPRYSVSDGFLVDRKTATIIRGIGDLRRVDVPAGTKVIAPSAFSGMASLVSATVPDSVKSIGDSAFAHCPKLEELRLPKQVDFCGGGIVRGCARLKSIEFPSGTKRFGGQDLNGCDSLLELDVPEGVVSLDGWSTISCRELARLSLPASLRATSGSAFGSIPKLDSIDVHPDNPSFRSENGVLFSKDMTRLVRCPEVKKGVYDIPQSVTKIDPGAFSRCRELTEIRIPEGVAQIGWDAFENCPAKTNRIAAAKVSATTPATAPVPKADGASAGLPISAFPRAGLVAGFTFNDEDRADDFVKKGRKFALQRVSSGRPLDLAQLVTNGALRLNGVYSGENANITNLEVPELRYDRFTVAMNFRPDTETGRTSPLVSFGGGWRWFHVLLRGDGTPVVSFRGLEKGEISFPLPEKVRPGEWNWIAVAFDVAEHRLSVVLNGRRIPDIALPPEFAFRLSREDRARSRNVQFANTNNGTVFKGEISGFLLFDHAFTDEEFGAIAVTSATPWTFRPDEEGSALYWNGTVSDGAATLEARLSDGKVAVSFPFHVSSPKGVLDLRKAVRGPDGAEVPLVGIGAENDEAYIGTAGHRRDATEMLLPATLLYIGPGAFKDFATLARIDCPDSVRRIGSAAFSGCRSLRRFRVGPAVEAFSSDRVFMGCAALEAIEADSANVHYKTVDGALFTADGKRLVAFPPGRKGPFAVPAGVEEIPARAFLGCKGLTRVMVPASVKKIGEYAFADCPALERIEFENRAFKLDDRVFGIPRRGEDIHRPATNLGEE